MHSDSNTTTLVESSDSKDDDKDITNGDSNSTIDIVLISGIAGGVGGVLLMAIVVAVIVALIYRRKLAESDHALQQSIRNSSIRSGDENYNVPMVEGHYDNPVLFSTTSTKFTALRASELLPENCNAPHNEDNEKGET
jgi:methyl-accepting chemotaxis protein